MKQTIISKCFGKMKRVALTLFAALCVGSVWGEESKPQTRTVEIDGGYKIFGLGENRNETAVVFTKTGLSTWTVPFDIEDAQFLVVGGGGGGGARAAADQGTGGAGGGGGGVVTGLVNFVEGDCLTINVGAGGQGGTPGASPSGWNNHFGASYSGGESQFSIDGLEMYVKAYGGGRDQGVSGNGTTYASYTYYQGGTGGSNAGSRGNCNIEQSEPIAGDRNDAANRLIAIDLTLANKGGNGESGTVACYGFPAAGGGGGALTAGSNADSYWQKDWSDPNNHWHGGAGGEGLLSEITGELLVYGSGGGGATTMESAEGMNPTHIALGGGGAGNGGNAAIGQGSDALPNQGGGGGGSSGKTAKGGAGGSGIVVFRYVSTHIDNFISLDELESPINTSISNNTFVFNGQNQSPLSEDLLNSDKYSITGDVTARDAGTYTFSITPNEGCAWDDETRTPKEFTWTIHSVNPACGYVKNIGDEVVVVFTNHNGSTTWTVPYNLNNVEFLVVGGGAGGGADARSADKSTGGAGGGGGGVVTGLVNFVKGDCLTVKVGAGGNGGSPGKSPTDLSNQYGASYPGGESQFSINDCEMYVKAYGGGRDQGVSSNEKTYASNTYYEGGTGGSNAGSRGNCNIEQSEPIAGDRNDVGNRIVAIDLTLAHKGGDGESGTMACWGYPAAGGGGGALAAGQNADSHWQNDWDDSNNHWHGGAGGEGLPSAITGELLVYGSGGGGATTMESAPTMNPTHIAHGGTGAGNGGNAVSNTNYGRGTDALANQGGGGGGSSGTVHNGGNGGSGIVVFRYSKINAVANIGDNQYESLEKAIGDATENDVIQLVDNIDTDAAFVIAKKVTIDLNGKTIATTQADTEGNGVFWVKTGGELTLNGEGTINGVGGNAYNIAIWADGGKVTINGGTYTNVGAQDAGPDGNHFDLIYVKNGGAVEINGGTFKCETPNWTLNSNDTKKGTIVVKGGTFYQFNPSDCATEGAGTNFCADGYAAELNNEGYYVVVKLAIAPNGATEVTASSSDDAASKVTILVPDAMKDVVTAVKYAEYFVKSAEYNASTRKYTVTAALNPDVVKPVIAETEGDTTKEAFVLNADGSVTLNINNKKPGLYYGVQVLAELGADPVAVVPETNGSLLVPAEKLPDGNAAFFKVIVDFNEIKESPKAE